MTEMLFIKSRVFFPQLDAIDNRDVPLDLLFRRFEKETDPVQKKWLMEQVAELAQVRFANVWSLFVL